MPDGAYRCGADGVPAFIEVDAPTDAELHALLQTLVARLMRMLTRRGVLTERARRGPSSPPEPRRPSKTHQQRLRRPAAAAPPQ